MNKLVSQKCEKTIGLVCSAEIFRSTWITILLPFRPLDATMSSIRQATTSDFDQIWPIFQRIIAPGDTLAFSPDTTPEEAKEFWFGIPKATTFVYEEDGLVLGAYILKPNQIGLGSHISNATFIVHPDARGKGIGRSLGDHCLEEAKRREFKAMQFNLVVSTNTHAVKLWQSVGFTIVGTVPAAFHHLPSDTLVDIYVMHRLL